MTLSPETVKALRDWHITFDRHRAYCRAPETGRNENCNCPQGELLRSLSADIAAAESPSETFAHTGAPGCCITCAALGTGR